MTRLCLNKILYAKIQKRIQISILNNSCQEVIKIFGSGIPSWCKGVISVILLISAWEILVRIGVIDTFLIPEPSQIALTVIKVVSSGEIFSHILASLKRIAAGFLFASLLGLTLGFLLGRDQRVAEYIIPVIELFRPIPPIAWIPIALIWFGLGDGSAYFIVFLGSFFPIFVNTLHASKNVPQLYINAGQSLGMNKARLFREVIIPHSIPQVITGMRIAIGFAWMTVIAAELIGATSGLGYFIELNRTNLRTDRIIVGMLIIGLVGFLINYFAQLIENKLTPWREN